MTTVYPHLRVLFTVAAMDHSARKGDLRICQWLFENRSEGCSHKAGDWAAAAAHMHIVRLKINLWFINKHRMRVNSWSFFTGLEF
jgi:hypothetical protein